MAKKRNLKARILRNKQVYGRKNEVKMIKDELDLNDDEMKKYM